MITEKEKAQARYILAIFFILCGLVIGAIGMTRHYVGVMPLDSAYADELMSLYPDKGRPELNRVIPVGPTLHYDIRTIKPMGDLTYTMLFKFWWLIICVGLIYIWFGVKSIQSKTFLFVKENIAIKKLAEK